LRSVHTAPAGLDVILGGSVREAFLATASLEVLACVVLIWCVFDCDFGRSAGRPIGCWASSRLLVDCLLQVAPLPYDWWTNLPGRAPVKHAFEVVGLGKVSQPFSLDPDRTLYGVLRLCRQSRYSCCRCDCLESVDGQSSLDDYWSCGAKRIVWADANSRGKRAHSISLWR